MKRMLGVLMALLLFAAPAIAQSTTVAGDWELISIVIDGVTYEDLAQQGMLMTMRLEEDGTGVQTVNSDVYACTWTAADGAFLIDNGDGAMSFVLQPDGTLLGQDHVGDSMIFAPLSTAGGFRRGHMEADRCRSRRHHRQRHDRIGALNWICCSTRTERVH